MTVLSPDERDTLRALIDEKRRDRIDDAGGFAHVEAAERHANRGPISKRLQNRLSAERLDVLESEQETKTPVEAKPAAPARRSRRRGPELGRTSIRRCAYCGAPSRRVVCRDHEDLL